MTQPLNGKNAETHARQASAILRQCLSGDFAAEHLGGALDRWGYDWRVPGEVRIELGRNDARDKLHLAERVLSATWTTFYALASLRIANPTLAAIGEKPARLAAARRANFAPREWYGPLCDLPELPPKAKPKKKRKSPPRGDGEGPPRGGGVVSVAHQQGEPERPQG